MSTDWMVLQAMESRTQAELRYFELVELRFETKKGIESFSCFVCVGDHSLFFIAHNIADVLPDGRGETYFAHFILVVEDSESACNVQITLSGDRDFGAWEKPDFFLKCQHRTQFCENLRAAWQTDYLWRLSDVKQLPCMTREVRLPAETKQPGEDETTTVEIFGEDKPLKIKPFKGYQLATHEGFTFFMKEAFETTHGQLHSASTAVYVDNGRELTVKFQAQEPQYLVDLENSGSEHIRWVALRQKQAIAAEAAGVKDAPLEQRDLTRVMVVRSGFYLKKMNLVNDIASWTGWELVLKSDTQVRSTIFLRRSYLPPLMDSAQDLFVTLMCPKRVLDLGKMTEEEFMVEARLIADTVSPVVQRCTVPQTLYRYMIQAKLNALLYSEDAMQWIKRAVGLSPDGNNISKGLEYQARRFVKSILKILQEESVLASPVLLDMIDGDVAKRGGDLIPTEKLPLVVTEEIASKYFVRMETDEVDGQEKAPEGDDQAKNAWKARVARYLAYCIDNGPLLGPDFGLQHIVGDSDNAVTQMSRRKLDEVLLFLLHMRPKDMSHEFISQPLSQLIHNKSFLEKCTFNDRVMQALIELKWIERVLGDDGKAKKEKPSGFLSLNCTEFLSWLLKHDIASINLKVAICRELMQMKHEHSGVLTPALIHLVEGSNIQLKTHAMVTLSSMAALDEAVKNQVMAAGIVDRCNENIRSADDDLIQYTLVLLVHLSKMVHHRIQMMEKNTHIFCVKLLEQTPPGVQSKQVLLAELVSVIGQLCNRPEMCKEMFTSPCGVIRLLKTLYKTAPPGGWLRSKTMFALKMFADDSETKTCRDQIGEPLLDTIMNDLREAFEVFVKFEKDEKNKDAEEISPKTYLECLDCATNAMMLLTVLMKNAKFTTYFLQKDVDKKKNPTPGRSSRHEILYMDTVQKLSTTELATNDTTRERFHHFLEHLEREKKALENLRLRGRPKAAAQ